MSVEITPRRRTFLTIALVAIGLLAIATWTESRDAAFFATMSLDHARQLSGKEGVHLREFGKATEAIRSSEMLVTGYSVSVLILCFASAVAMWIPPRNKTLADEPPDGGRESQ